tara:strand:- start:60 stop:557 length:498 start_codon:yes stop_codon:yes gene_type:complete
MKIKDTSLPGVKEIQLDTFEDHRGQYVETFNKALYEEFGINIGFVCDDISVSDKNVLRGIHGDDKTWKLISCLYGKFYLVVLNNDSHSSQYGQWESFVLSDTNRKQILVPPKFGNGHLVLSDKAIFHYKQSEYYNREGQFTIKWNDSRHKIWWPINNPILSRRDS